MLNTETFRYSLLFRGMKCKTFPDRGGYTDQFFQKTDSMKVKVHVKHQLQKNVLNYFHYHVSYQCKFNI